MRNGAGFLGICWGRNCHPCNSPHDDGTGIHVLRGIDWGRTMTYREYYRNDDGEQMGYGTVYDDDIDPDVYYDRVMSDLYSDADNPEIPCEYCGNPDCQDDCEVIRCEADIAT